MLDQNIKCPSVEQFDILKNPGDYYKPDYSKWNEFVQIRYGLQHSDLCTDENLFQHKEIHIPWFDLVAKVDL